MAGEVSCRAIRPLFRYLSERNLPLADVLADSLLGGQDLFLPESWVSQELFEDLVERAAILSSNPRLAADIGNLAGEPCPFGPISPQAVLAGRPEVLLQEAEGFLGLLQRGGQVIVRDCRPGNVVIEWLPPPDSRRGYHTCTYARHLLGALPRLFGVEGIYIRETQCAVAPAELRPSGSRCTVDAAGTVWEIADWDATARRRLGSLDENGTLLLAGTRYGTDRCIYEITWPQPGKAWRRLLTHLSPASWLQGPLFRQIQNQRRLIQELRAEIRRQELATEARVLERTEELRVRARKMAQVEQAGRRFASIADREALAREAVRTLREDLNYFTVALYFLQDDQWTLSALESGDDTIRQQVGHIVYVDPPSLEQLQRVGRRPSIENDLTERSHPLGLPHLGRGRSCLSAPLFASDRLLGVIDLQSPRQERFDQDDASILHTLSTQVALSLERSQLYREERRARQRADAMAVLARVINTTLELDQVLTLALHQLRRVLPYDGAAVVLRENGRHILAASNGLPPQTEEAVGPLFDLEQRGPLSRILQHNEPLLFSSLEDVPDPLRTQLGPFSSWLAVPLAARGTVVGAFLLAARQDHAYSHEDLRTAEDLAGQVATAIENARLYDRIRGDRDRLDSLYRIAQELNSDLGIDEVLRHILNLAQASVGAKGGSIILLDEQGEPTHSITLRPTQLAAPLLTPILTRGAAGWAIREQRGLLVHDTHTDSRWLRLSADPWETRSAIVVPLVAQNRVIGVLTVMHPQVGCFDQDDLDLLSSVAGQASSVVQRAYLFEAIRGEQARLEAVIEGTADAVIVLDEAGKTLHLNPSAAELFHLDAKAVTGQPAEQALQHPTLPDFWSGSKDEPTRTEVPLPDGRTLYATRTPIPGVGAVITMQDITYLKELDRMKSDFVANVSHDLRTPLAAVQGYAEMLDLAGPLSGDQTGFVRRIIHSVESMTDLVENLLDLAKIEAGVEMRMAPCQLAAVIAESVDQMAGPAAMKPVSLNIQVPPDLPLIWGNGRRLGQVLNNLLDNAIKYAPPEGQVSLRISVEESTVQVEVADDGPGISAADLPRIFEKFYRARGPKEKGEGSGLGLSIAHSIVQAHHGRIWVESKEGEGTRFFFSIPVWTGEG